MTTIEAGWVPDACTLPTADRPLRLAEFDGLFRTALVRQERTAKQQLRWRLDPATAATVHDLTTRESRCCSFFAFTIAADQEHVDVDVDVTPDHVDVLDALEARAAAAMAARS